MAKNIPRKPKESLEDFKKRTVTELDTMEKLQHPHLVQVFDAYASSDQLIIVMEFCDLEDLGELIEQRSQSGFGFSEDEIMRYFVQICFALQYLHDKNIMHRDVKPDNIFISGK